LYGAAFSFADEATIHAAFTLPLMETRQAKKGTLQPVVLNRLGARLREEYEALAHEEVPKPLADLLTRAVAAGDSCEMTRATRQSF
jgi:hypothetical protein